MGRRPGINFRLVKSMGSAKDTLVDDLRERSAVSRRNLAQLRENGGNSRPLVFPEGHDDVELIRKAFGERVDIRLVEGGKSKCLELAQWLTEDRLTLCRVIVDRDFDGVAGVSDFDSPVLIRTEAHDTLMDVLYSAPRVLPDVVRAVNEKTLRDLPANERERCVQSISDDAISAVFKVATIRIYCMRHGVGLDFESFSYDWYLRSGDITVESAVNKVLFKNSSLDGARVDLTGGTVELEHGRYDLREGALAIEVELAGRELLLIGDHDFLAALSSLSEGSWGERKLRKLFEAQAERDEIISSYWGTQLNFFLDSVKKEKSNLQELHSLVGGGPSLPVE